MSFSLLLELLESLQERQPITIDKKPAFAESYNELRPNNPDIIESLKEFFRCKKAWPQLALPSSMKDHALKGDHYKQFKLMECHLSNDILLLYQFSNHTLTLLLCCNHNAIKGPNAKAMVQKIKNALAQNSISPK